MSDDKDRSRRRRRAEAARPAPATPRRRLGGRSARVRASVLEAAFRLLMKKGTDAFSIAEVAAKAGVHETSIYRRWGTKHALIRDACLHLVEGALPMPDTGSLRSDLITLLDRLVAMLDSPEGRTVLVLSVSQHPHIVAARRRHWQRRFGLLRALFAKAVARGECPRDVDPIELIETLIAPLYLRVLLTGESLDEWPRREMVDRVLTAYGVPSRASG
jgi:AcrR family transcriptional regulator